MTNDEWIAFLDRLTPEQREAVERARSHFGVVYDGTLGAFLGMLKQTEEHQAGVRGQLAQVLGNQPVVVEHLERQDKKLEALAALPREVEAVKLGQAELAERFSSVAESVSDLVAWQQTIDAWRKAAQMQIDTFEITRRESRLNQDRLERKIDEQGLKQEEFHQESSADRRNLREEQAGLREEQAGFRTQLTAIIDHLNVLLARPALIPELTEEEQRRRVRLLDDVALSVRRLEDGGN